MELYRFIWVNSNGEDGSTVEKPVENERHAESLRKNYEVESGFPVRKQFVSQITIPTSVENKLPKFLDEVTPLQVNTTEPTNTVEVTDTTEVTESDNTSTFPRNWHLKKRFVSKTGRVYSKGIEDTSLFGTLPPDNY
jgi:hypothetical protein